MTCAMFGDFLIDEEDMKEGWSAGEEETKMRWQEGNHSYHECVDALIAR